MIIYSLILFKSIRSIIINSPCHLTRSTWRALLQVDGSDFCEHVENLDADFFVCKKIEHRTPQHGRFGEHGWQGGHKRWQVSRLEEHSVDAHECIRKP